MPDGNPVAVDPVRLAIRHLARCQMPDGAWEGEVVWCPVITAQIVLVDVMLARPIGSERRRLILRHFAITRRPDGGWGLHPQSASYLFVTTLVYVAARLLDEPAEGELLRQARQRLATPPGICALPQWGKIWLTLLGLYDRRGLNPCPPELFLLPHWLPGAPSRLYCHTRYIYLGLAYLLGSGFTARLGPVGDALREELYGDIASTAAVRHRHDLAASDAYVMPSRMLRLVYDAVWRLGAWRSRLPGAAALRRLALKACFDEIVYEERETRHQGLSPVNGLLNTLAIGLREPRSDLARASRDGLERWQWADDAEGLRYAGARSTTWDTSFAMRALLAAPHLAPEGRDALRRSYRRLAAMQIAGDLPDRPAHRRDPIDGGWCFSDGGHRWPVSDCTAEALSAILLCHQRPGLIAADDRLADNRLNAAVAFMLARQNRDGGFGTYERRRGGRIIERFNPSEMFGQCMTELSYIECTASVIGALQTYLDAGIAGDERSIRRAIDRGAARLLAGQREEGAWPGFWGINFIYGTRFAIRGLREVGLRRDHPALRRAHAWLCSVQHEDGGWGEHFSGCLSGCYVDDPASRIASTAWAVLTLLDLEDEPSEVVERGCAWLTSHQQIDGGWPHDGVNGVFFGTAMLDYRLYNTYFPTWALALLKARRRARH